MGGRSREGYGGGSSCANAADGGPSRPAWKPKQPHCSLPAGVEVAGNTGIAGAFEHDGPEQGRGGAAGTLPCEGALACSPSKRSRGSMLNAPSVTETT